MVKYGGEYWFFVFNYYCFGVCKNGYFEIWVVLLFLGFWREYVRNFVRNGFKSFGVRNGGGFFVYEGKLYCVG